MLFNSLNLGAVNHVVGISHRDFSVILVGCLVEVSTFKFSAVTAIAVTATAVTATAVHGSSHQDVKDG